jgi:hypothetical protein
MAEIDHLEIPDTLLESIRQRASAIGISLEEQLIRDLSAAAQLQNNERQLLDEIRREREEMAAKGVFLTEEFLKQAIDRGRT